MAAHKELQCDLKTSCRTHGNDRHLLILHVVHDRSRGKSERDRDHSLHPGPDPPGGQGATKSSPTMEQESYPRDIQPPFIPASLSCRQLRPNGKTEDLQGTSASYTDVIQGKHYIPSALKELQEMSSPWQDSYPFLRLALPSLQPPHAGIGSLSVVHQH